MALQPRRGNFWEGDVEAYLAGVRERQRNPPRRMSRIERILRAVTPVTVTVLAFVALPFLFVLPAGMVILASNGLILTATLVLWYLATAWTSALVFYIVMVGRPPTWHQILMRWRWLHRTSYKW